MWSGRRGSSSNVKAFGSVIERDRRRTCVGSSSRGEGAGSERGVPPPLRDDVMDLNHELRCVDF